eukprot:TRINITY_DN23356_c0_g5_i1.p1 TRINITY_DN23356_c0_g5~~TRINITY_DN23356_c0_g5_i1.p1  ORF type:complete len:189 (+),score=49.73 TRINITY_DN23356_c0_g5_i1:62-628(+)
MAPPLRSAATVASSLQRLRPRPQRLLLLLPLVRSLSAAAVAPPADWPACAESAACLFSSAQLLSFDGSQDENILVSVVSYVFNVTKAPHYYRRGLGSYAAMAGRDASRVLATMSMDEADVASHRLAGLDEEEMESLFGWVDKYQERYPLVGRLVDWEPGISYEEFNRQSGFSLKPPPAHAVKDGDAEL